MAVVREHNYHPNAVAAAGLRRDARSIGLVIPDLENTSYTRIANYLERQARQRGYQPLIACVPEDQPDNEMRCIEHLLQRRWMPLSSRRHYLLSTVLSALGQRSFPDCRLRIARSIASTSPALLAPIRMMPKCWPPNCANSGKTSCILARYRSCRSVSVNRGFRTAWHDDPREVQHIWYANSFEREAAGQLFEKWLETHPMPQALFTTSFPLLQG